MTEPILKFDESERNYYFEAYRPYAFDDGRMVSQTFRTKVEAQTAQARGVLKWYSQAALDRLYGYSY